MKSFHIVPIVAVLAFALPASADGPELSISSKGDIHIIGVELTTVNAINLFSLNVWGLRLVVPIDRWTTLEGADGKVISATDILQGHRLEVKGRIDPNRSGWLDTRLIKDLSIGTLPPPQAPADAEALAGRSAGTAPPPPAAPPPPPPVSPQPSQSSANISSALTPPATPPAPPPLPATGKRMLTQQLRIGMRGGEVVVLQEFLQKGGWGIPDDGPVTGYYGKVTANAVRKFQASNGLPPEGEVGPKTRELINRKLIQP